MSDTPRTDSAVNEIGKSGVDWHYSATIMSNIARQLERENAELRECLKVKDEALRYLKEQEKRGYIGFCGLPHQRVFDKALAAQPEGGPLESSPSDLLTWAVERWNAEVANRPLVNIHRRALDDTWRQVIRHAGGNPDELIGPSHDVLLAAPPERPPMTKNASSDVCEVCGAPEIDAMTPRTVYACGSSDYDKRPGTFKRGANCIHKYAQPEGGAK